MEYYVNDNIIMNNDGLNLCEITLEIQKEAAETIYKNRGKKISVDSKIFSESTIETLIRYSFLSEIENHYNLVPNINFTLFGLESKCFLEWSGSINNEIGVFEIPYYQGTLKHDFSVQSIFELKEASYKIPNPNDSYIYKRETNQSNLRKVYDYGFLRVNSKKEMEKEIYSISYKIFQNKKQLLPLFIGGDHAITYPVIKGIRSIYKDEKIRLLYLDAHSDLGLYKNELTNGNVMSAIHSLGNVEIVNYGMRGPMSSEEVKVINENVITFDKIEELYTYLCQDNAIKTYISIDLDVFDPSVIDAVTFPVGGGIDILEFEKLLNKLENINIIGCDIVEYNNSCDYNRRGAITASEIIYRTVKHLQSM